MTVSNFIDDINALLKIDGLYYETKKYFCLDCRVKKEVGFDETLLDELKILGILQTDKERYTRASKFKKFKNKSYRWFVIDKEKFKSLERLISRR